MTTMRPQSGPQTAFLQCSADIAVYGGAAGGGKTFGLLLDDLYHVDNPGYTSATLRRTFPQILNPGGLWDTAAGIFLEAGGVPNQSRLEWRFPSGALCKFSHLQYESDKFSFQGSQLARIGFDELDQFSDSMFWYMLSRNRSVSGVRPYMRATTNANADSWVADLISWWIDWDTGFPIPERAGVVRWFVREGGQIRWANAAGDLPWVEVEMDGQMVPQPPKSLTFIPAKVTDNTALLKADPGYLSSLLALPPVDRARLLEGNWKVKVAAGAFFKREWFPIMDLAPAGGKRVRYWDFAATAVKPGMDPDYTCGALVSRTPEGFWFIEDITRIRTTPAGVEALVKQTAELDGRGVSIYLEQEPGSSGKIVTDHFIRSVLPGFHAESVRVTGPKQERIKPVSSQAQVGNIRLVRGNWIGAFLDEAEQFPDGVHDDQVDAVAGAFEALTHTRMFRPEDVEAALTAASVENWLFSNAEDDR